MTTSSRNAERADRDRLLGIDTPPPWQCPHHLACTCPPPQPPEHCPEHGDYTPTGMDASCPACEDRSARIDAHHTHRWQLDDSDLHRYRH